MHSPILNTIVEKLVRTGKMICLGSRRDVSVGARISTHRVQFSQGHPAPACGVVGN